MTVRRPFSDPRDVVSATTFLDGRFVLSLCAEALPGAAKCTDVTCKEAQ
jgi:hypothetical protein